MRGNLARLALALAIAAATLQGGARPAGAETVDVAKAAKVKAAYLLNFVRYAQWSDAAFERSDSPIVLTLVGSCDLEQVLPEVISRSEPVGTRQLELQRPVFASDVGSNDEFFRSLDRSHLVYVCSSSPELIRAVLDRVGGSKALTVGDTPDFADNGGMLGFVLQEGRIVFEANPTAIQGSSVTVSAKVLKLARIVGAEEPQ